MCAATFRDFFCGCLCNARRHGEAAHGGHQLARPLSFLFTNLAYTTPLLTLLVDLWNGGCAYLLHNTSSSHNSTANTNKNGDSNSSSSSSNISSSSSSCSGGGGKSDSLGQDDGVTEDLDFFDQLRAAAPAQMSAPPRVWSLLRTQFNVEVQALLRAHQRPQQQQQQQQQQQDQQQHHRHHHHDGGALSSSSSSSSRQQRVARYVHDDRCPQLREVVRRRFAHLLGPRLQGISTGGAKTPAATLEWMKQTWRHTGRVNEGYGSTEVGSIAANGTMSTQVQMRLEDCPEMGYTSQVRF